MILAKFALAVLGIGSVGSAMATEVSLPTNGVYVAIGAWRGASGIVTNQPIKLTDELVFMAFCDTGKVELAYPPPEYCARVGMRDENGKDVSRRRPIGSRFDENPRFQDVRCGFLYAWGSYSENPELGGGRPLGKLEDLFHLDHPGTYTLTVQLQMFRLKPNLTNAWNRELFRFPPVNLTVQVPRPTTKEMPK